MSAPASVRMAGRQYRPGVDKGVATLLTAASWILQRLPGQVLEGQRGELVEALGQARDLVVEVRTRPSIILIRDGDRALISTSRSLL